MVNRNHQCLSLASSKVKIDVQHKFSAEIENFKRQFILDAHSPYDEKPKFHLFSDVKVFSDGEGFCSVCDKVHKIPTEVDVLFVGPSCKNLSKEFLKRVSFADCYSTGNGSSGYTYVHGVRAPLQRTNPMLLFFENVLGVAESQTSNGVKTTPPVEAGCVFGKPNAIYIYIYIHDICIS